MMQLTTDGRTHEPQAPTHTREELKAQLTALKREFNQKSWQARLGGSSAVEAVYREYEPRLADLLAKLGQKPSKHGRSHSLARGRVANGSTHGNGSNVATRNDDQPTPGMLNVTEGGGGQKNAGDPVTDSGGHKRGPISETPVPSATAPTKRRIITLPNNWTPRPYQVPVFEALDSGIKRVVTVWHRRAGKDHCAMNYTAKAAHERVGIYWHVLPTQKQARKAVWEGISKDGYRLIDQAFPKELRARTREDEMMIEFKNGSIWRCVGGDSFDGLVGSNPVGVVFSEYSIMDPRGWRFTSPILAENGGWAWFIGTPRGKNHFYHLYEANKDNPNWFTEIRGVEDTNAIPLSVIEEERAAGMPENMILQEYFCSFEQANAGTVYGNELTKLRRAGKICTVRYDARYPVETYWDIGVRDATAIIFAQRVNGEVRVIDYYSKTNEGFPHYAEVLRRKGYAYSRHIGPHDLEQRLFISGVSTTQMIAQQFGIQFTIAPKVSLADGIEAGRAMLSRATLDETQCADLIAALEYYHRKWDEDKKVYDPTPVHDWSSHPCSAWMYGALVPDTYGTLPQWAQTPNGLTTGLSMPVGIPVPGLGHQPGWTNPTVGSGFAQGYALGNPGQPYDPLAGWR